MHIMFWLLKDMSWCLNFKPLAITMIIPTLCVAVYITIKNKTILSELMHNLAVIFWITANSLWMVVEFMGFDETPLQFGFTGRHLALFPFTIGLVILLVYYMFMRKKLEMEESEAIQ